MLFLQSLYINGFRNIKELSLDFSASINLFIGPNGHGKTNCLEAIALSLTLRSMHSLKNADLINYSYEQAHLAASMAGNAQRNIAITILPKGKKALLNNQALKNSLQLSELVSLVTFIPAELSMIQGAAGLRRRALDQAACALFFEHTVSLKAYERTLAHRNKLLKAWPIDKNSLAVFTELLIKEGSLIIYNRLQALKLIINDFKNTTAHILGQELSADLYYQCQEQKICDHSVLDIRAFLTEQAQTLKTQETHRKVTLFGPHLDDLVFLLRNHPARTTASRGQSRALVLSFKIALMKAVLNIRGVAPIVILDDIVSELDNATRENLLAVVSALKTQCFFSATEIESFNTLGNNARLFKLKEGKLTTAGF